MHCSGFYAIVFAGAGHLSGAHTYQEADLAQFMAENLRRVLGFEPKQGEFLTELIRNALWRSSDTRESPAPFARSE